MVPPLRSLIRKEPPNELPPQLGQHKVRGCPLLLVQDQASGVIHSSSSRIESPLSKVPGQHLIPSCLLSLLKRDPTLLIIEHIHEDGSDDVILRVGSSLLNQVQISEGLVLVF